ncbi:hypothetical protein M758_12G123300 [Ceratodon purpureus]|nr:hypothetical protein M758_12G123300 [Ceratodon purpureus]
MLLRDDACGAIVDNDPDSVGPKVTMARPAVHVKGDCQPALSDDIENSEGDAADAEKPDEISDDSSNLEDEVPVATKLGAGRVRRRKVKSERGDGDDGAAGGKRRARKAAPRDWLLKYLQPNVSNVADRSHYVNAGMIVRASTDQARERKGSCEDFSLDEGEQEQPPSVGLASRGQPEDATVAQAEGIGDYDDEDSTDFEELAFTKRKGAIKDGPICEKAKLKDQAGEARKTPATVIVDCSHPAEGSIATSPCYSFSVLETQEDDLEISPRKPLAQNHQRDVESVKCYLPDRMPQIKERKQKENEAPRKRKLSLPKDSRRQSSLKSFLKSFPVQ